MNDEKIGVSEVNTDTREEKKEYKEKATKSFWGEIPRFAKIFYRLFAVLSNAIA